LKINVAQRKFILEFAIILVRKCRDKHAMATISVKPTQDG